MAHTKTNRIELLDGLRGFAVILMICHHITYDTVAFLGFPWALLRTPPVEALHYVSAGLFILLAGISSRFSHSNLRRGGKVLLCALAVTVVTSVIEMPIIFGILHFLGLSMVLYGLTRRLWERLPGLWLPVLSLLGLILTWPLERGLSTTIPHLWIFGLVTEDFYSADYFPLFPWFFLFLLGTYLGGLLKEGKGPGWVYRAKLPGFSLLGRHSLGIYLVHQPLLYFIFQLLVLMKNG